MVALADPGPDPGWHDYFAGEHVRCPAIDRRRARRAGDQERRKLPRMCGRTLLVVAPGSAVRVRVARGILSTVTCGPGGLAVCRRCQELLELVVVPVVCVLPESIGFPQSVLGALRERLRMMDGST